MSIIITEFPAVMIFGRFQGITKAHEKMFHLAHNEFSQEYFFISPTQDHKSNPLSWETRYKFLHGLYPKYNFVDNQECKNPFEAVFYLGRMGHKKITLLVGPDRVAKFESLKKYVNHPDPEKRIPNVEELCVLPFGVRDPDSKNEMESLSASKVRQAVKDNNFKDFSKMIPDCDINSQVQLYINIREGLGLTNDATTTNEFRRPNC